MITIHKYTFATQEPGVHTIQVRKNAVFLHAAAQNDRITIWFKVDTHEAWMHLDYVVYLTGQEFDPAFINRQNYIATLLFDNGGYVVHVYQIHPST